MYSIRLEWKEFNVDLAAIESWVKAQEGSEDYSGASADTALTLWFQNEPSEELKEAIQTKWDELDEESDEALSYKTADEIKAEAAAAREALIASAATKLAALGLTEEEIAALRG